LGSNRKARVARVRRGRSSVMIKYDGCKIFIMSYNYLRGVSEETGGELTVPSSLNF
jgi:hypothetical protein